MLGLLNINKPAGLTSRDAVNRVQWLLRQIEGPSPGTRAKVGHAGTLDPLATGVLVLCLGSATKLIEHVQRMPKRYQATFLLGQRSESDDTEMEVELLQEAPEPSREQIDALLPQFMGEIQQVPPIYSAIKVGGQRSYKLARDGETPKLAARPVMIYELQVTRYEYPELELDIRCGSGTYVRSLGRDLAAALGTAAVMSALERTEIGPFTVDTAIDPSGLTEELLVDSLLPASLAVAALPRLEVNSQEVEELRNGRFLSRSQAPQGDELAAFNPAGELIALVKPRGADKLQPTRNFL